MRPALGSDLRRTAWRIGVQTAALVIVCLAAVGALVYGAVVRSQDSQTTQTLNAAADAAVIGGPDDRDGDNRTQRAAPVHTAILHDGVVRSSSLMPDGLPDAEVMNTVALTGVADRRTEGLRTGGYDVLTVRRGESVVQVAVNLFEQHQERERILGALGIGGAVGVVLSAVLGALLAHRAVQPMAKALTLQRRFVADAGHELRTPPHPPQHPGAAPAPPAQHHGRSRR